MSDDRKKESTAVDAAPTKKEVLGRGKDERDQENEYLETLRQRTLDEGTGAATLLVRESARLQTDVFALEKRLAFVWKIIALLVLAIIVIGVCTVTLFPKWRYIATTDNSAVCELTAQANLALQPADITEYAKDGIVQAMTYDYVNYNESINYAMNRWFNESGRKAFLRSLDHSDNLQRVIKGRYILKTMASHVPQIEEEGMRGRNRYWIVQVPLVIEFYQGGDATPRHRIDALATVTVVQEPPNNFNRKGIGIESVALISNFKLR